MVCSLQIHRRVCFTVALVFALGIIAGVFYYKMYYLKKKSLPCVLPSFMRQTAFVGRSQSSAPDGVRFSNPIPHALEVSVVSWGVKWRKADDSKASTPTLHDPVHDPTTVARERTINVAAHVPVAQR